MNNEGLIQIGELLRRAIGQQTEGTTSEVDIDSYTQRRAERYNKEKGKLNLEDGYNCNKCLNRGNTMRAVKIGGMWYERFDECQCMKVRRSIARMKASGLEKSIRDQRLDTFKAEKPWQKAILEAAKAYIAEGVKAGAWLYIGGQAGSGKTHICTAVARELLYAGYEVRYVIWEQVKKELKAVFNDPEYAEKMNKLESAEVLYIDDLFKPIQGAEPTKADMQIAFELFNYRYANRMPTIISSELFFDDIYAIDQATEGRIRERCGDRYNVMVEREDSRNLRRSNIKKV